MCFGALARLLGARVLGALLAVALGGAGLPLPGLAAAGSPAVEEVRIRPSPDRTRIVFDLSRPTAHTVFVLGAPHRLVVDLAGARLEAPLASFALEGTPIRKVRSSRQPDGDRRVVFDLSQPVTINAFPLKPIAPYGDRLVVDLCIPGQEFCATGKASRPPVRQAAELTSKERDIVIAIDPGHGGDDPGALGPGQLREKQIVLQVAKHLHRLVQAERGFRSLLIREGDYYLSLRERTAKARRVYPDALVSIHADSFKDTEARGASVYALSDGGATSEAAARVADRENAADLVGGYDHSIRLAGMDDNLARTMVDLTMTNALVQSLELGKATLAALGKLGPLHKRRVERAGFVVLKADWPAVLIEVGFISNPAEARLLATAAHQRKLAGAIFQGLRAYFYQQPPDGTYVAHHREPVTHTIVRGDTLSALAVRYRVSQRRIKELNGLRSDTIKVGQTLEIPPI